ncbi:MAG: hypothetical protein IJU79_06420 [Desulfovibrionaceae bacterium]|nr:hypothetical protein [Desulfovibrionaceae bacterium]
MSIEIIIPFFNIFRDENLPLWLSLGILGFGFLCFIIYYFHVYAPIKRSLRKATHSLEKIIGYTQFYLRLPKLDSIFTDSGLKHNWDEFKQTLILPSKFSEEKIIRNTIRPHKYFNFESLSHHYNISLYQALPNIIVGFGLLLTFCGLVSAIYLTGESIISQHSENVVSHSGNLKNALDSLLKVAAFKFLTSIAGLITSLILTIEIRICNGKLRNEYNQLNTLLERNMLFASQEQLLSRQEDISLQQLDSLKAYFNRMQKFSEHIAKDTAQKTALAINAVLKMYVERSVEKIDPILTLFAGKIENAAQGAMSHLVKDFSAMLQGETHAEMQALTQSLHQAQIALDQISGTLNNAGNTIDAAISASAKTLETALEKLAEVLSKHAKNTVTTLEQSLTGTMEGWQTKILEAAKQFAAAGTSLEHGALTASSTIAKEVESTTTHILTSFKQASTTLNTSLQAQTDNLLSSSTTLVQNTELAHTNLTKASQDLAQNIKALGTEQGNVLTESIKAACQEFTDNLKDTSEHLQTIEAKVCESITKAKESFATCLQELEAAHKNDSTSQQEIFVQALENAGKTLEQAADKASQDLGTLQEKFGQNFNVASGNLHKALRAMGSEMYNNLSESSQLFDSSLKLYAKNLGDTTSKTSKHLLDVESMVCGSIAAAADGFKATCVDLQQNLKNSAEVNAKFLKETLQQGSEALEKQIEAASTTLTQLSTDLKEIALGQSGNQGASELSASLDENKWQTSIENIAKETVAAALETLATQLESQSSVILQNASKASEHVLSSQTAQFTNALDIACAKITNTLEQTTTTYAIALEKFAQRCTQTSKAQSQEIQANAAPSKSEQTEATVEKNKAQVKNPTKDTAKKNKRSRHLLGRLRGH